MRDYGNHRIALWLKKHEMQIKSVIFCSGLSSIGSYAIFLLLVKTVVILNGVKSIRGIAFEACKGIFRIFLSESVLPIGFNPYCKSYQLRLFGLQKGTGNSG